MRAFIYRNVHKHCYSVRNEKLGRVTKHTASVLMKDATLVVSKAGRERVLREKQKNIHAGIRGELVAVGSAAITERRRLDSKDWTQVYYNPFKVETFVEKATNMPIFKADYVLLTSEGVFVR